MNITFLIGNGFDLGLGLKTSYADFCNYFIENASEGNLIRKWMMKDGVMFRIPDENTASSNTEILDDYDCLWSDLEKRLGECVGREFHEEYFNCDDFFDDKQELISILREYLHSEQERFSISGQEKATVRKLAGSMTAFGKQSSGFTAADETALQEAFKSRQSEEYKYNFLCFNYTNTLDQIINVAKKEKNAFGTHHSTNGNKNNTPGNVLHVHGTLDYGMILGVNDPLQLHVSDDEVTDDVLDIMVKERMNTAMGTRNTENADTMINGSRIICIFGMSIGLTDRMWWQKIVEWLRKPDAKNMLVINDYRDDDDIKYAIPEQHIRLKKEIKEEFLQKAGVELEEGESEEIKNRIFIIFNSKMFEFPNLVIEETGELE